MTHRSVPCPPANEMDAQERPPQLSRQSFGGNHHNHHAFQIPLMFLRRSLYGLKEKCCYWMANVALHRDLNECLISHITFVSITTYKSSRWPCCSHWHAINYEEGKQAWKRALLLVGLVYLAFCLFLDKKQSLMIAEEKMATCTSVFSQHVLSTEISSAYFVSSHLLKHAVDAPPPHLSPSLIVFWYISILFTLAWNLWPLPFPSMTDFLWCSEWTRVF